MKIKISDFLVHLFIAIFLAPTSGFLIFISALTVYDRMCAYKILEWSSCGDAAPVPIVVYLFIISMFLGIVISINCFIKKMAIKTDIAPKYDAERNK